MRKLARVKVTNEAKANVKYAAVAGKVTVGVESAARLTKKLGRPVYPGEVFDLGTLAEYNSEWNWFQRVYYSIKQTFKRHEFS